MADIVNAYFRRFYPAELDHHDPDQWQFTDGFCCGWEYSGPGRERRVFPTMLCADGFKLSVQGRFGAYCYPNDDFSDDPYILVEVKGPAGIYHFQNFAGEPFSDGTCIYARVPTERVETIIEVHGGLFDWNAADLGVLR